MNFPLNRAEETARTPAEDILASVTEAFIALDRDWRVVYVNPFAARSHGKKVQDIVGKDYWEEWPGIIGTDVERQYRRAMAERIAVQLEHHDGESWLETRAYPSDGGLAI